jgi:micrococcal nuclease
LGYRYFGKAFSSMRSTPNGDIMKRCAIVLVIILLASVSMAGAWTGKVVKIMRADEYQVLTPEGQIERVRVYGIDCPQEPQAFGREARLYSNKMLLGKDVEIEPLLRDHFNRIIAYVHINGLSIGEELLKQGLAWWYKKYVPWELGLAQIEDQARETKIGLWADRAPVPPWEFQDLPPGEGVGPATDSSIWRRGIVRERIIHEVGRSRQVIGDRGRIMNSIRQSGTQTSVDLDLPRVRDVESIARSVEKTMRTAPENQKPEPSP